MGDRQPFRFRLPSFFTNIPSRSTEPPTRPPPQRPPFRPAGIAPAPQTQPLPPSQTPAASRTAAPQPTPPTQTPVAPKTVVPRPPTPPPPETQTNPPSPPASSTTTQVLSQLVPPSPPLRSRRRTPSLPQSPQKIRSPPRYAPDESGGPKSSKPASPSGGSAPEVVQLISLPKKSEPTTVKEPLQASPPSGSTQLSSANSQERGLNTSSTKQPPHESQLKIDIIPESTKGKLKEANVAEERNKDEELELQEDKKDQEKELMIQGKKRDRGKELLVQENKKDKENEDATHRITRPLSAAVDSVKGAREGIDTKIQTLKTKQETHEIFKGNNDQIKTVQSTHHPKPRSTAIDTHQKPGESNGEPSSLSTGIKQEIDKMVGNLALGQANKSFGGKPISVVTLAGDNKGAAMNMGSDSSKKDGSVHIHRGYKSNPDESPYNTTDAEGTSKGKNSKDSKQETPVKAYVNNNVQSANNSIVFASSVFERNPGVQMVCHIGKAEPGKASARPENVETRKSEIRIMPAEKLTYEPTVRRRCLRGLFLETSDSEPDNPQKPRRHGCRFRCGEKGKEKDIGVF